MKTTKHIPLTVAEGSSATPSALPTHYEGRVLNVWMVDDHLSLRQVFSEALNRHPGIHCIRTFASGAEVLQVLDEERPPDIILLDVNLGDAYGVDLIRPIKKLAPAVKILMFTMFRNVHCATEAFHAGASGFLLKTYEVKDIVRLIRQAYSGDPANPASPASAGYVGVVPPLPGQPGPAGPRRFRPIAALRQLFHAPGSGTVH